MRQRIPVDHWDRKGRELLGQPRRLLEVEARHIHIPASIRQHTSGYVSVRQDTRAYVSILGEVEARHIHIPSEVLADFLPCLSELPALAAPSAYVRIREHT
jgi:hypothetical protein